MSLSLAAQRMGVPPLWEVPRDWVGETCWILCGGESLRAHIRQDSAGKLMRGVTSYFAFIPQLLGRVIAVKESVLLKPDADLLFLEGESTPDIAVRVMPHYRGPEMAVRGKMLPALPRTVHRLARAKDLTQWSDLRTHVCGYDSGTSAIDLAIKRGATTILLLGYDMAGHRWFRPDEWKHPMPHIPNQYHVGHMQPLASLAADARRRGVRIVNCSPISRVSAFEKQPLEAFL